MAAQKPPSEISFPPAFLKLLSEGQIHPRSDPQRPQPLGSPARRNASENAHGLAGSWVLSSRPGPAALTEVNRLLVSAQRKTFHWAVCVLH